VAADFDAKRLSCQSFEGCGVACRCPEFEFRVPRRAQLQQVVVAAVVQLEAGDGLRVAPVQAFREAQDRGERPHRAPGAAPQVREAVVLPLGRRLTMIPGDEGNRLYFVRLEAAEVAVLHQVVGVFVMALVADVDADVVQDRGILEPLALAIGEAVNRAGLIEEADREPGDVLRVRRPVVAALGELEDAAAARCSRAPALPAARDRTA
jgi:hypothetical protein